MTLDHLSFLTLVHDIISPAESGNARDRSLASTDTLATSRHPQTTHCQSFRRDASLFTGRDCVSEVLGVYSSYFHAGAFPSLVIRSGESVLVECKNEV